MLFRSQIGAFKILENAKKKADENPGYKVYDACIFIYYIIEDLDKGIKLANEQIKKILEKIVVEINSEKYLSTNIDSLLNNFKKYVELGKDVVLCCYEDVREPNEWCHRLVFAEWWLKNTGERIEELPNPAPVKSTKRHKLMSL